MHVGEATQGVVRDEGMDAQAVPVQMVATCGGPLTGGEGVQRGAVADAGVGAGGGGGTETGHQLKHDLILHPLTVQDNWTYRHDQFSKYA